MIFGLTTLWLIARRDVAAGGDCDASPKRSPQPAEAVDPSLACSRDEQRLARLRAEPDTDQIVRFEKELACENLRPQVQRLRESVGGEPAVPPAARNSTRQQQVDAGSPFGLLVWLRILQRLRSGAQSEERQLEWSFVASLA